MQINKRQRQKSKYIRHNKNHSQARRAEQYHRVPYVHSLAWIPNAAQQKQSQQLPGHLDTGA